MGNVLDTASQYSIDSGDADTMRRRRLYAELRNNLMQMIMPLDEKNHVINNANEELSRHIRRQDEIWPHIADEISEETRLGSLRHWALVDLNPTKKTLAAAARGREAALLDNNEVAERSERRREAMALAKKQKTALQQDSDVEARKATRKGGPGAKKVQETEDALTGANNLVAAAAAMTKTASSRGGANKALKEAIKNAAARGGVSMSRENSQQETTKKRKAATAAAAPARKRYVSHFREKTILTLFPDSMPLPKNHPSSLTLLLPLPLARKFTKRVLPCLTRSQRMVVAVKYRHKSVKPQTDLLRLHRGAMELLWLVLNSTVRQQQPVRLRVR